LSASASSNLAVSLAIVSGPATLTGGSLQPTGIGNVVVRASQPGNSFYAAASDVSATIAVNPAPLAVTAQSFTRNFGDANPVFAATLAGLVNGETLSLAFSVPAPSPVPLPVATIGANIVEIPQGVLVDHGGNVYVADSHFRDQFSGATYGTDTVKK